MKTRDDDKVKVGQTICTHPLLVTGCERVGRIPLNRTNPGDRMFDVFDSVILTVGYWYQEIYCVIANCFFFFLFSTLTGDRCVL